MPDIVDKDARLQLAELREQTREQRRKALAGALALAGDAHRNSAAAEQLEFALGRVEQLDKRIGTLSNVSVVEEPDIYRRGGEASFFLDLAAASGIPVYRVPQAAASERLERHGRYEQMEMGRRSDVALRKLSAYGIQARNGSQTGQVRALSSAAGAGGEMVPPKWIVEEWASVSRAACALKGLVTRLDLPDGTLELNVPRFDSSAGVVPMQAENVDAPDLLSQTDAITSRVATFAGDSILSQQEFDRGGHFSDEILLQEFGDAYAAALGQQMMSGTGTNGQLLGLLNVPTSTVNGVPGARTTTYTDASPTPAKIVQAVAQCAGEISDTRERAPSVILMRGARWFYLSGSPDGSGNVSEQRLGTGVVPGDTDTGPWGPIASLPVYHDNTIPTTLGGGANQDAIVLVRGKDILLLEDPAGPRFTAMPGTTSAGQMAVVLGWHTYTASIPQRYPSAIGTVTGTGLVVPSGF